jgi:cytochrome c oxidase subunit I+III
MSDPRRVLDVSALPSVVFSHRSIAWWGTAGFMVIEGFTLLLMVSSYFYLRLNEYTWPPEGTPDPDLLLPTINTLLLLAIMVPMWAVNRAAKRFDRAAVGRWLLVATLMTVPAVVLRWYDLQALNARWDMNAYASAAWGVVILHSTLLVVDLFETGAFAVLFLMGHAHNKHYPDASGAAEYQFLLSLVWVPLYLIVYWGPRVL